MADHDKLRDIFPEERVRKAVISACKRAQSSPTTKKRTAQEEPLSPSTRKRARSGKEEGGLAALSLPEPAVDDMVLEATTVVTNRAPLLLAFAVVALEYTHPEQPLSSRLSIAGGVVATNALSKARSVGIASGEQGAEEKKLFAGTGAQPTLTIFGRDIKCLRRYTEEDLNTTATPQGPLYWALDLEQLAKPSPSSSSPSSGLPIHKPEAALSYLTNAFTTIASGASASPQKRKKKMRTSSSLPLMLGALHLLFRSWKDHVTPDVLGRRAWDWYCAVRPEVPNGPAGWGARGEVRLRDILRLRKGARDQVPAQ